MNRLPSMPRQPASRSSGFTLLEVLIALIVLSIGLLGIAGLQLQGLRYNQETFYRDQAVTMAYDMADRMRTNPVGTRTGLYHNPVGADNDCVQEGSTAPSDCTVGQMAAHDFGEWNAALAQLLPGGNGTVCIDSDMNDADLCDNLGTTYTISVRWTEVEGGAEVVRVFPMRLISPP